ncbi:acyl-CoA dehydrogenase family protein [Bradyrhizobium sp. U87765 SZCCT0131]|nr:acyl-CoA dehydrogenase family protein [Bradyrhizobium sp. U87765 SZCCT0131]MBR1264376.1 acyl-CoA dehydrogenase family protein [Bradyrhizobium sp. U87765 SZCCT0134]MBR1304717.1 acyl-CoA dehydrogenase family protein [Bradyrhizobium sp. U87765 SZCCT0110]MBR1322426.1 acyl-CoA dehydrogenase family protein [Bradyrhizobium sp. U87765 SZCCT0109]MBR1346646.1 acyl-CoA dehydrogenase family protein [Bradyrhizobium sp. U87765 SZCCT0048]
MPLTSSSPVASITSPAAASWRAAADEVAAHLRSTAVERERRAQAPHDEVAWLRKAGLLTLLNPEEWGGGGASFGDAFAVVRIIARADASIAQILSYHYLLSHSAFWRATPDQAERLIRASVAGQWFWGGASNPRDPLPPLTPDGDGFRLSGRKTFASNASLADRITLRAGLGDDVVLLAVPGDSVGISHGNDWDAFGQRLTESGSVSFDRVRIERDHILGPLPAPAVTALPALTTLVVPIHQLLFVNFYLGTAEGALQEAAAYIHGTAKPWQTSGVAAASEDPYILAQYGELHAELRAALALADVAAADIEAAIHRGDGLTSQERTAAAATVYAAKVNSTRVALEITSRIFELMGARATSARYGFDRFWRNIRTHSLHDPVVYKAREVGNFVLNGRITPDALYT